ncbi:ABC transporter ATP-binding protein [Brevibacterium samyangense]|uniref:ABC transporter ATP-binding protein n=1 Tax=Brevibacterium samyangense TaxID=366888 RepID=A0ABN2TAR9_9MICO
MPENPIGAALELRSVSKKFGDFTAVDGISLTVEPGEFVTFLGPSGSGKTTTLNCIAGFEEVTDGEVMLGGKPLTHTPIHKRNIGMVFQGYALFPHMTVEKNVAYPLKQRKLPKEEIREATDFALEKVGLTDFRHRLPVQLSGGQRQRVALARAICFRPPLLLMDEPLSALDKALREQLQQEIRSLHRDLGTTVVFVTHDQDEALALSDRIVVFNQGVVQQIGTPRDLYQNPANAFVSGFVGESVTLTGAYDGARFTSGALAVPVAQQHDWTGEAGMMVRPENVGIGASAADLDPALAATVEATVEDVTYVGNSVKYRVSTPAGGGIVRAADSGALVGTPGDTVTIGWKPEDARVLPVG